ncbi:hypothetical protein POF50_001620 [Streptomyces sp. SL13]|uniref:Uncharacterized protein n=1 Tax=Streptantibioticus silvisoli TaxID=2705255 RepID=A0AA90GZE7_9ACTN|nr:hypothetical protein [Streptantibioticus silvisoli]MDI5968059.1 hypothetical protein [Streptantibioticus silvisoli]
MANLQRTYAQCVAEGGLTQVSLGDLRAELGYRKLGKFILSEIIEELDASDLGYFPREALDSRCNVEPRQHHEVWIYARDGSSRAAILDAVLCPERVNVRRILDGLAGGDLGALTPREKLDRIREIVQA